METVDVSGKLDNLVVAFISQRSLRILTRNEVVIAAIYQDFVVKVRKRSPRGKMYQEETEIFDHQKKPYGSEILCPSGLLYRLVNICNVYKVPLKIVDVPRGVQVSNPIKMPPLEYFEPDEIWNAARDWQHEALRILRWYRCGRMKVSTGGGKSELIAYFCRLAKKSRICVAAQGVGDVEGVYKKLSAAGVDAALVTGTVRSKKEARVICCSAGTMLRYENTHFDVMLVDEVHTMAAETMRESVYRMKSERIFGLSANQDDRADKADMWIEALFGPIVLERSYSENLKAGDVCQIKFRFIETTTKRNTLSKNPVTREKTYLIANDERNEQIASVARHYLGQGRQVLILTRTTEHVLRLAQCLPGALTVFKKMNAEQKTKFHRFGIWHGGMKDGYTQKELDKIQEEFGDQQHMLAIANTVWHKGKNFRPLDTVIRAEGTNTAEANTQLAGRLSRVYPGKEYGLLIDCIDAFDQTLYRKSRGRRKFYLSQGWEEVSYL